MRWIKNPYMGPLVRRKKDALIRQINEGQYPDGVYVIMLAINGRDNLDIRRASSLVHDYIHEADPLMVGLAANRTEAMAVVEKIVTDCYALRKDADLRAYISGRS